MKPNITSTSDFKPNFTHKFFLDSNVWFYLIFPQYSKVGNQIISKYSSLYDKILDKGLLIETTILQISELVNLILRVEFKEFCIKTGSNIKFKDYIKSSEGENSLLNAKMLVNKILKCSTIRQGNLNEREMVTIMDHIHLADFNDMCFARHCEKENSILVTHDFDFKALNQSIEIVSANENYLS